MVGRGPINFWGDAHRVVEAFGFGPVEGLPEEERDPGAGDGYHWIESRIGDRWSTCSRWTDNGRDHRRTCRGSTSTTSTLTTAGRRTPPR